MSQPETNIRVGKPDARHIKVSCTKLTEIDDNFYIIRICSLSDPVMDHEGK